MPRVSLSGHNWADSEQSDTGITSYSWNGKYRQKISLMECHLKENVDILGNTLTFFQVES